MKQFPERGAPNAPEPIGVYRGIVAPECGRVMKERLARMRELLAEPHCRVLSEGRNRTLHLTVDADGRTHELAVKVFGRPSAGKDLLDRWRGSKASRTWRAARHLHRGGVGTPPPIAYLERRRGTRLVESYYISRFEAGCLSFKQALIDLFRNDPRCEAVMGLLEAVAGEVAAMHDAGLCHNDLGNQNILLRRGDDGTWSDVAFIDLNRARFVGELSPRQRARDLSRLFLPSDLLRVFKEMYYRGRCPPASFQRWERTYRRLYAVHCRTRAVRHPIRERREDRAAASDAGRYPAPRDVWLWDERSAQAIVTLRPRDRARHYAPAWVWTPAAVTARALPRVWRNYRELRAQSYRAPVAMDGRIGLSVEPREETWARERMLLEELGSLPVLIRLYHHEDAAARTVRLRAVQELAAGGRPVAIALVQDRRAVQAPDRWRHFVREVLRETAGAVDWVEVGHAVNRVKWGVWSFAEHRRLLQGAAEAAAGYPNVRWMGPAAIDFEYPFVAAALENLPPGMRLGALSHHLYVDRRGAPENRQGRFDALDKFALARAIARWAPACDDRLIVSEVNWPLAGTGVYSPVGAPYVSPGPRQNDPSVSEEDYAVFMLRYLAIAVCSGLVDRVYWWRLAARGFGLVDDRTAGGWRKRPAFQALKVFVHRSAGCTFRYRWFPDRAAMSAGVHVLAFDRPEGSEWFLGWSSGAPHVLAPGGNDVQVWDLYGRPVAAEAGRITLTGSPVYFSGPGR